MVDLPRHNVFRLFVALLAVSVVVFPAAGAGAVAHCRAAAKSAKPAEATVKTCCAKQDNSSSEGQDGHLPGSSKCARCLHACCAPAVDVVHVSPMVAHDREVVASHVMPAESVHDPVTCDAIFHPPRA